MSRTAHTHEITVVFDDPYAPASKTRKVALPKSVNPAQWAAGHYVRPIASVDAHRLHPSTRKAAKQPVQPEPKPEAKPAAKAPRKARTTQTRAERKASKARRVEADAKSYWQQRHEAAMLASPAYKQAYEQAIAGGKGPQVINGQTVKQAPPVGHRTATARAYRAMQREAEAATKSTRKSRKSRKAA